MLSDGSMVETAAVGEEGMLGIEAFYNDDAVAPGDTLVQVPDTDVVMLDVKTFRRALAECSSLHDLMGRYAQVFVAQIMQSTACNARHQVQERCCRWLLTAHDRMHQHDFDLSHEFLAMMLGVRRQTVTVVAGTLQSAGLIRYTHGRVAILDRKGLEAAACECYQILRRHFDRLR
jgi:CRP-like cAMP-binding protein